MILLYNYCQVHACVDDTIVMERAGCIEGANDFGLIGGADGIIVDHGRARLGLRIGSIALPGAIGDNMRYIGLINQCNAFTFFNGNAALREIIAGQTNRVTGGSSVAISGNRTGNKRQRKQYQQYTGCKEFFHGKITLFYLYQVVVQPTIAIY
jgi:hypothetical protein